MNFELIIDGSNFITGSVLNAFFIFLIIFVIGIGILSILWHKIWSGRRENEMLKYEFVTIIAHKFRTPLTQMKWIVETLLVDEKDSYKKENLVNLQQSNQTLISLTGTLIELSDAIDSSKSAYTFETLNMCDLTRTVADSLKTRFHEKNLFFSVKCDREAIMANADRPRMEFVIQTLLENACAYSPIGRNVEVTVSSERHHTLITVTDHGIGIDKTDIPRIFTKFYRTENAKLVDTEGFGVGLFLAQNIMKKHSGRIEVSSPGKDQGTTFVVSLPEARA